MPLVYEKNMARFVDACTVEEAMEFQEWLGGVKAPRVDLSACTHLHTALFQVLLAARPKLSAPPQDPFLARWVAPLLAAAAGSPVRKGRMA
jgi:hypothetical protein